MKYVVFEDPRGQRFPVLFGNHVAHSQVKLELGRDGSGEWAKPISAGEWHLCRGRVETGGQSVSLGLKPRKTDAMLISYTLADMDHAMVEVNVNFVERKLRKLAERKPEAQGGQAPGLETPAVKPHETTKKAG